LIKFYFIEIKSRSVSGDDNIVMSLNREK